MMKTVLFCKLATLPLLLASCAIDGEASEDLDDSEEVVTQEASSYCMVPPNPPPLDAMWVLPPDRVQVIDDYGSGDCAAYVLGLRYVEAVSAKPAVSPTTAEACTGTSITMRRYRFNAGVWSYLGTETQTGVWTYQGCRLPSVSWAADTTGDVRIHVKAKQTTCSGQYCGTSYALPLRIAAQTWQPTPPPN